MIVHKIGTVKARGFRRYGSFCQYFQEKVGQKSFPIPPFTDHSSPQYLNIYKNGNKYTAFECGELSTVPKFNMAEAPVHVTFLNHFESLNGRNYDSGFEWACGSHRDKTGDREAF